MFTALNTNAMLVTADELRDGGWTTPAGNEASAYGNPATTAENRVTSFANAINSHNKDGGLELHAIRVLKGHIYEDADGKQERAEDCGVILSSEPASVVCVSMRRGRLGFDFKGLV